MKNNKDINERLRELLIICTYNIKGLTKRKIIEKYLPLKIKNLDIYQKDNRIIFERDKEEISDIWLDCNNYSNLEILKNITPIYGIECKGDNILDLMKYRSKIIKSSYQ